MVRNKWYTKQVLSRVKRGAKSALSDVGNIIGEEAQKIAPFEFGELESSMHVDLEKDGMTAYISFSKIVRGADIATIQHENLSYRHLPGKRAKYLQEPFFSLGPALLTKALSDDIGSEIR